MILLNFPSMWLLGSGSEHSIHLMPIAQKKLPPCPGYSPIERTELGASHLSN